MAYHNQLFRTAMLCVFAIFVVFCLFPGVSHASSIRLPLDQLAARSELAVQGRVERIESAWTGAGIIESTVYMRSMDVSRGDVAPGALIQIRVRGGRVDDLTMNSSEEATFVEGETVYLFLFASSDGVYRVTEGKQGKFSIIGDRAVNRAWDTSYSLQELQAGVSTGQWPVESAYCPPGADASNGDAVPSLIAPENYVLTGKKWFGPNPMEEDYLINVNTSDTNGSNGSVEAFRNAVIGAGNTWSNAGAKFAFRYGGATGITSSAYDEKNVIRWEDMGSTSTLAEATWWSYSGGQIIEVDIRFNDHYSWDATGSPSGSEPDVQSIASHEMGHWLSLNHDDDPSCSGCPSGGPVMCRCYTMGTVKRTLASSDIAGIKALYGSQSPSTATPTPTATPTATPTRTSTRIPDSQIKDRRYLPLILH